MSFEDLLNEYLDGNNDFLERPIKDIVTMCAKYFFRIGKDQCISDYNNSLIEENKNLEKVAENRGAFIDWVGDKYPEILSEYTEGKKQ